MVNASLIKHRANAYIDKDKLFDWFLKWFGDVIGSTYMDLIEEKQQLIERAKAIDELLK